MSAFSAGLKHVGIEFRGLKGNQISLLIVHKISFVGDRGNLSIQYFFEGHLVQLVYEICNFYCISAGFNEGQALGRIQAPLVPVLNPMQ